jgi:rod shape-determining protein MreC
MEFLLTRFRNLSVLLVVVLAQLLLLAYQVKGNQDIRLIRVWSVTAVTPIAKVLEVVRRNTIGVVEDYFVLIKVREENRRLADELGKMKMENHFLKSELQTAERAQALGAFQARTPSRTVPARIIGTGTGANSRVVYLDQGSGAGILRGMAVVTPEGIVGKVLDSYPTASQVLLITDAGFAAGVISQKNRVHGTIKGQGQSKCLVDYVENEEKVEVGEMFYTSGDDRIFPKGMPVGRVNVVRQGKTFKEIYVVPSGLQNGVEEVLIVVQGEHQAIPQYSESASPGNVYLMKPPQAPTTPANALSNALVTDADRLRQNYKAVGEAQGHQFGEGGPGSRPPNFNLKIEEPKPAQQTPPVAPAAAAPTATAPATSINQTNPSAAPPKPRVVQIGPDGQPIAVRPKAATTTPAPDSQANPSAAPPKPRPVQIGPDGQPVVVRPKPATTTPAPDSQANPSAAPPKPGAVQIGPDGQPVVVRPKPATTTPAPSSQANPSAAPPAAKPKPAPATQPSQSPAKQTAPPPTKPKPEGTVVPANP